MANELEKQPVKAEKTKEKATKPAPAKKPKKSIVKYFKDARSEFKKVVWPAPKQVFNNTVVVVTSIVVSGIAIWGLDSLFTFLLTLFLQK